MDSLTDDQSIERIVLSRVDPDSTQITAEAIVEGGVFYTEPLPVGGRWRIASIRVGDEELTVSEIEFDAATPGLLFLGSIELRANPPRAVQMRRLEAPDEREILQTLLDRWRRTAWREPIRAAIRSLDRE